MSAPEPDAVGDRPTSPPRYVEVAAVLFVTAAVIQGLLLVMLLVAALSAPPHSEGWEIMLLVIVNLFLAPVTLICGGAAWAARSLARRR